MGMLGILLFVSFLAGHDSWASPPELGILTTDPVLARLAYDAELGGEPGLIAGRTLLISDLKLIASAKREAGPKFEITSSAAKTIEYHLRVSARSYMGSRYLRQIPAGNPKITESLEDAERETWSLADRSLSASDREALILALPTLVDALAKNNPGLRGYLALYQLLSRSFNLAQASKDLGVSRAKTLFLMAPIAVRTVVMRNKRSFAKFQVEHILVAQSLLSLGRYFRQPVRLGRCASALGGERPT